jgi:Asp-tRNA(Asn)/Glu-tRNA(Gln) amidotransferase A subunit family amidase
VDKRRVCSATLGIAAAILTSIHDAIRRRFHPKRQRSPMHRAIRARQITATQLVNLYFKRIEAYNGTCVKATSIQQPA